MANLKVDFEAIPWESPAPGFRFKAHREGSRQLRVVEFFKEFAEPDWCTKGHYGCVLEGELEVDFSGKRLIFKEGDGVFIPAGESNKHKARALTNRARLFFVEDVWGLGSR